MNIDFLVFFYDGNKNDAQIVRVVAKDPHAPPRGADLCELLIAAIQQETGVHEILLNGAVELPSVSWNRDRVYAVVDPENYVEQTMTCDGEFWKLAA